MKLTRIAVLAALVTVGLSLPAGTAAAEPPVSVDHESSDRCEVSQTADGREVTVHYPCGVGVDRDCTYHGGIECTITVTRPTLDSDEPVDYGFCHEGHNIDPVPCVIDVGI